MYSCVKSDIKKLKSGLTQSKANREAEDEKLDNFLQTNLTKLSDDVVELRKYSEVSEKSIFNGIKTSVVDIKTTLDTEKNKRYIFYQLGEILN